MSTSAPSQIHTRLRVFLAVAHHLSFTRAGEELSITTGAVSQQIKLLEDWLGQRLFRRLPRRLELTDAGKRLLTAVDPAYAAVDLAIGRLRGGALSGVVRVRTLPSFLATWLVPRLPRLMARFPQIELQVEAEDSTYSLRDGEFDLAIDLNDGTYPGFQSTVLLEEEIFPVCSPRLLEGRPPLLGAEDETTDCVAQIETVLRESGLTDVVSLEHHFPLEYCDDCGAPLYPSPEGEVVHAEMPEEQGVQAPRHLH